MLSAALSFALPDLNAGRDATELAGLSHFSSQGKAGALVYLTNPKTGRGFVICGHFTRATSREHSLKRLWTFSRKVSVTTQSSHSRARQAEYWTALY